MFRPNILAYLTQYGIRPNFPVTLVENSQAIYPGERGRTEYLFESSQNKIIGVKIHFADSVSETVLVHELGHLKLRCLGLPVLGVPPDMPALLVFFTIIHDEFYVRVAMDNFFPEVSIKHNDEEVNRIPSRQRLNLVVSSIPPYGTPMWYEGMISFALTATIASVCSRSQNLSDRTARFQMPRSTARATSIQPYLDEICDAVDALPELPTNRGFSDEEKSLVIRSANRIIRKISNQRARPLEPTQYSIDC